MEQNLFVGRRTAVGQPFTEFAALSDLNTQGTEGGAWLSGDRRRLYYTGGDELRVASRSDRLNNLSSQQNSNNDSGILLTFHRLDLDVLLFLEYIKYLVLLSQQNLGSLFLGQREFR